MRDPRAPDMRRRTFAQNLAKGLKDSFTVLLENGSGDLGGQVVSFAPAILATRIAGYAWPELEGLNLVDPLAASFLAARAPSGRGKTE
jgi:hypothetical protein